MRVLLPLFCVFAACSPSDDNADPDTDMGVIDTEYERGCEGGLVEVDGECVAMSNALEVLLFRSQNDPTAQVCARTYTSDDPGIEQAVVAERGVCRVFDTDLYGPLNYAPATRESGVLVARDDDSIVVDEAEIFDSCVERRDAPDGFFAYGTEFRVSFDGNGAVPAFDDAITIPEDPGFERSPLVEGEPVVFSWAPSVADEVIVFFSEGTINVVCQASAGLGRLEVPADFVSMLPEPEPPQEEVFSSIRLRNRSVIVFADDDAAVTLTADTYQSAFEE